MRLVPSGRVSEISLDADFHFPPSAPEYFMEIAMKLQHDALGKRNMLVAMVG